ncbi:MAG: type II toxin-antitoxin system VapC family toxin [Candidatus Rokubacteria bacterium]|nr:type II toxin-antitoxin system VapC family toxin [Candidatus Rokubacteria bacterium]
MAQAEKRYWDSSVFLASIKNEAGRAEVCENILTDARGGRCEIFTSMLTLTEVVKRRPREIPIDPATEQIITDFFRNAFIKAVPLDLIIAERARRVIWDFPWLGARDAIHIATALQLQIPVLEHYDDDDLGRVAGRIAQDNLVGFPVVRNPLWTGQAQLPLAELPTAMPEEPPPSRRIVLSDEEIG